MVCHSQSGSRTQVKGLHDPYWFLAHCTLVLAVGKPLLVHVAPHTKVLLAAVMSPTTKPGPVGMYFRCIQVVW